MNVSVKLSPEMEKYLNDRVAALRFEFQAYYFLAGVIGFLLGGVFGAVLMAVMS